MKKYVYFVALFLSLSVFAGTIDDKVKSFEKQSGFFNFYWDSSTGKVYLEISHLDTEFLYINYLQTGVGSNDIGLDRGQIGDNRVVKFQRQGPKILLIQPNQTYRAISDNRQEVKAVADGFAQSVIWGGDIVAEQGDSVLVNISTFLLRDSQSIASRLKQLGEGQFSIDDNRSVVYINNSKSFPDNTEFEALITLKGSEAGSHLRSVSPNNEAITVRTHHSFVRLPDQVMQPRKYDPRSGGIPLTFYDYAAPLNQSMKVQWAIRHRLEHTPDGGVKEPIVYYLDSGTPEPVRSALLEGAKWWQDAFEAAGFSNAYEVKMLPPEADPLDVRYNTIQWVHRSTRGWSYGASVVDPRSGEILKGHVTLGSLRVRQDMAIAQALLSPFKHTLKDFSNAEAIIENMALARLRQLSAHEVGHTLGLIHNFHASSRNRSSVMDYPHPLVKISDGEIDLSDAYGVGVGAWDKVVIDYLYRELPSEIEAQELQKIIDQAQQDGHIQITDRDARAIGGAHPQAHLWDNGTDPVQALYEVLEVRAKALQNFGLDSLRNGDAVAELQRLFVPLYLFHRYQVEAVVKLIAGMDYYYAFKSNNDSVAAQIVPAQQQQKALTALLTTLKVTNLTINESILELLLPLPAGDIPDREIFTSRTGLTFDLANAAESAADQILSLLLHPQRMNRLSEQHARDKEILSVSDVLKQLTRATWQQQHRTAKDNWLQDSINWVTLKSILHLADHSETAPVVKATVDNFLREYINKKHRSDMQKHMAQEIKDYFSGNRQQLEIKSVNLPPGSPIGS